MSTSAPFSAFSISSDAAGVGLLADLPLAVERGVGLHVVAALVQAALACRRRPSSSGSAPAIRISRAIVRVRRARRRRRRSAPGRVPCPRPQGVDQPGQGHAARPLRVVVPHGDVAVLAQSVEHLEAVGLRDVLQVHGAEARLDHLHEVDDLVGVVLAVFVVAVDAERDAVDAAEVLHQEGLALHHAEAARRRDSRRRRGRGWSRRPRPPGCRGCSGRTRRRCCRGWSWTPWRRRGCTRR